MAGTRVFKSPRALADAFIRLEAECDEKIYVMADVIMHGVVEAIKAVYGDESRLAPLAESTIIEKSRLGVDDPYSPLVRWGQLRDGTYGEMEELAMGHVRAAIGNDDPISVYHEQGTSRMPARPVHWIGANDALPMIQALVRVFAGAIAQGETPLAALRTMKLSNVK